MKKIDTTPIAPGIAYPFPKKGLNFLQQSYQEALNSLAQSFIGDTPSAVLGYVLYGCNKALISGSNYSFTAGAIYFNGEIYSVPAIASITLSAAFILKINDVADPVADPTTFTDLSTQHVHRVRTIVISSGTLGSGDLNYDDLVFLQGPLKTSTSTTGVVILSHPATVNGLQRSWRKQGHTVTLNFLLSITITSGSTALSANIPLPIPGIDNSPDRGVAHSSGPGADGGIIQIDRSFNLSTDMGIASIATYTAGTFVITGQLVYTTG